MRRARDRGPRFATTETGGPGGDWTEEEWHDALYMLDHAPASLLEGRGKHFGTRLGGLQPWPEWLWREVPRRLSEKGPDGKPTPRAAIVARGLHYQQQWTPEARALMEANQFTDWEGKPIPLREGTLVFHGECKDEVGRLTPADGGGA